MKFPHPLNSIILILAASSSAFGEISIGGLAHPFDYEKGWNDFITTTTKDEPVGFLKSDPQSKVEFTEAARVFNKPNYTEFQPSKEYPTWNFKLPGPFIAMGLRICGNTTEKNKKVLVELLSQGRVVASHYIEVDEEKMDDPNQYKAFAMMGEAVFDHIRLTPAFSEGFIRLAPDSLRFGNPLDLGLAFPSVSFKTNVETAALAIIKGESNYVP